MSFINTRKLALLTNSKEIVSGYNDLLIPAGYRIVEVASDMENALVLASELVSLGVPLALVEMNELFHDEFGNTVCEKIKLKSPNVKIFHRYYDFPADQVDFHLGIADNYGMFFGVLARAFSQIEAN